MSDKVYKSTRKYHCPFCDVKLPRMELIDHIEKDHEELIPENYTPTRVVYDSINKTDHGTCMICKKPVYEWNDKTSRYENLCGSKKCREEVRRVALERHIRVYNKPTLLGDPEHQEKMLANRHISGTYKHSDGASITYTGKYEKAAVEFMDKVMNIPSKDIQMPGPILEYEYNGEKHSWITDIYYIPANLIIEVKDGGNNPNNRSMPEYRGKQQAKEVMITELGKFNYLRLTNNDFSQLLEALAEIKYENMDQSTANKVSFFINESSILNDLKDYFHEEVGGLPPRNANNTWITPYLMNGVFDTAIGNTADDVVYIRDIEDGIKSISKKDFIKKYNPSHEMFVCTESRKTIISSALASYYPNYTFTELLYTVAGRKFRILDELALTESWKYFNIDEENLCLDMIKTGIIRENEILSGTIKVFNMNDTPLKGYVLLSRSNNGYFIHTLKDYYLSSNYYDSPEDIPQNIIDTMNDLYDQYKKRVNPNE